MQNKIQRWMQNWNKTWVQWQVQNMEKTTAHQK